MTRLERLALWALLTLGLCGCTRTVETRSESALRADVATRAEAAQTVTEVTKTGPETITTTVEEFEAEEPQQVPAGPQAAAAQKGSQHPDGRPAPVRPLLIKRTVVVDQRGPVVDTRHETATATQATTATIVATAKTAQRASTSYWPPWWVFAGSAGLLALGLALLRGWLKMPFGL